MVAFVTGPWPAHEAVKPVYVAIENSYYTRPFVFGFEYIFGVEVSFEYVIDVDRKKTFRERKCFYGEKTYTPE